MKILQSNVVVDGLVFPEGIRWHEGRVWFSDIFGFQVLAFDPATGQSEVVVRTEDRPSGLGFLPDGRLLIASMGDRTLLRLDPDGLSVVADLAPVCSVLNDMVVDRSGRAYVDAYVPSAEGLDALILVEPDGAFRIVAEALQKPNGLAITDDGKSLILAEFQAGRLLAFDIEEDGSLVNRRVFAELGGNLPDGICLDAEGAVWAGLPFQGKVVRILEGGEITHEIVYDTKWGVATVLGGRDRRTLFVCTAEVTLETFMELMRDPRTARDVCRGWIEAVDGIDVPGTGRP